MKIPTIKLKLRAGNGLYAYRQGRAIILCHRFVEETIGTTPPIITVTTSLKKPKYKKARFIKLGSLYGKFSHWQGGMVYRAAVILIRKLFPNRDKVSLWIIIRRLK
jgi:hypothetical protein